MKNLYTFLLLLKKSTMKKHIVTYSLENKNFRSSLAIFFLTIMLNLNSYGQNTQNVQSMLAESWSTANATWQNLNKNIYSYDTNGYMTNDLTLKWITASSQMQNLTQINYLNNPDGTVSQMITQSWDNVSASWVNSTKYSYTYNASNNVQSILYESWTNGNWQNVNLTDNTYTNSQLTNSLIKGWNIPTVAWRIVKQINYTYNTSGNLTIKTNQVYQNGTTWKDDTRNSYTYNTQHQVLTDISAVWDGLMWRSWYKYANSYASGILYNTISYSYPAANGSAYISGQNNYSNNSNGTVSQLVYQNWTYTSSGSGHYTDNKRYTYNYDPALAITDFEKQNSVRIYPNPATDIVNVKTNDDTTGLSYSIIDQSGRIVLAGKLNKEETAIDIIQLTKGVYLLQTQNQKKTVKLIKK